MSPSFTPSSASHLATICASTALSVSSVKSRDDRFRGSGNTAWMSLMNCAPMPVKSYAGAPATMPSKSSG